MASSRWRVMVMASVSVTLCIAWSPSGWAEDEAEWDWSKVGQESRQDAHRDQPMTLGGITGTPTPSSANPLMSSSEQPRDAAAQRGHSGMTAMPQDQPGSRQPMGGGATPIGNAREGTSTSTPPPNLHGAGGSGGVPGQRIERGQQGTQARPSAGEGVQQSQHAFQQPMQEGAASHEAAIPQDQPGSRQPTQPRGGGAMPMGSADQAISPESPASPHNQQTILPSPSILQQESQSTPRDHQALTQGKGTGEALDDRQIGRGGMTAMPQDGRFSQPMTGGFGMPREVSSQSGAVEPVNEGMAEQLHRLGVLDTNGRQTDRLGAQQNGAVIPKDVQETLTHQPTAQPDMRGTERQGHSSSSWTQNIPNLPQDQRSRIQDHGATPAGGPGMQIPPNAGVHVQSSPGASSGISIPAGAEVRQAGPSSSGGGGPPGGGGRHR